MLVNTTLKDGLEDFEKFKSRFSQLTPKFGLKLEAEEPVQHMEVYTFVIRYDQAVLLAVALTEQPGPLGWGSVKAQIDRHFPG